MKKYLLLVSLLAVALAACTKENPEQYKKRMAEERVYKKSNFVFRIGVNDQSGYHTIYQVCVDGVKYLSHGESLAPQQDINGKNIACSKDDVNE